jgi:hypothetical protein
MEEPWKDPPTSAASHPRGFTEKLELLKFYRSEDAHEWSILTSRIAAYITSQSFLMLSFASAMNNSNPLFGARYTLPMSLAIPVLGIVTSIHAFLGIGASCDAIRLWRIKQRKLFYIEGGADAGGAIGLRVDAEMLPFDSGRSPLDEAPGEAEANDVIHRRGVVLARITPWIFGVAWLFLIGLTLVVHFGR